MRNLNISGKVIKERQRKGWSLRELAEKAGVSHTAVFGIEDGKMPNLRTLIAVAKALGKEPAWFLK